MFGILTFQVFESSARPAATKRAGGAGMSPKAAGEKKIF
jgi:hypothetical protein